MHLGSKLLVREQALFRRIEFCHLAQRPLAFSTPVTHAGQRHLYRAVAIREFTGGDPLVDIVQ